MSDSARCGVGQDVRAGKMPGSVRRGVGQDIRAGKMSGREDSEAAKT